MTGGSQSIRLVLEQIHRIRPERPVEELHPFVAGLLYLWRLKCPPGGVPQRSEFNVFMLRPWFGWVAVYEELDDGADFLVRLDGSNIVALNRR